jgi:hypothetical protein
VAQKIKAALPPNLDLGGDWRVEWDAVDPATGDSVSGVVISSTSLHVAGDEGSLSIIAASNPILLGTGE